MNNKKNKYVKKEIDLFGKNLTLETGELAFQSNLAVKATYGDTVVLVSVVSADPKPDIDFFPLTVNYEEKLYAGGIIKSSRFVKRDGRPTDESIVIKRLIDHAIRPLFPQDYMDEVQVIVTVLSLDEDSDPQVLSMIATSAALCASDIPWDGPMVTARVGYVNSEYVLNPGRNTLHSALDMVVTFVGADKKFLAIEAEANILPEEKILGGIEFARNKLDPVLKLVEDFAKEVNPDNTKYVYLSKSIDSDLMTAVNSMAKDKVKNLLGQGLEKTDMHSQEKLIIQEIMSKFEGKYKKSDMQTAFEIVEKHALQELILKEHKRPDGRSLTDVRPIQSKIGVLPRTHGSALFTRGVTQSLTVATLGSPSLELIIQDIYGESTKKYIHYYNFPPFSVGETGKVGGARPREIGHGMLAEKALKPVIPSQSEFSYTVILVSEILSSSGSSSMAATCGSTLALMDAGVPIKDMVAGVGVGLISNDDFSEYAVMTDLAYKEDAFGFLDFKVAGTKSGVTAIQSDMKLRGIPMSLLPKIMEQSRQGRLHVLEEMKKTISEPKKNVSQYAPKTYTIKINPEKIGLVIGGGGKTIKSIQEQTKAEISIDDDGTVVVTSIDTNGAKEALKIIEGLTKDVKAGEVYDGVVKEVVDFGAFVEILPGKDGLLHISEVSQNFVNNIYDVLKEGDAFKVKVLDVGRDGKISLSRKALEKR